LLGCAFVPLLFGVVMVIGGVLAYRSSQFVESQPQEITCRELSNHGPGDNAHLLISDFTVVADAYVVQEGKDYDDPDVAWIPLVPAGQPEPEVFHVILLSEQATTPDEVRELADESQIQGVVENVVGFLLQRDRDTLADEFPGSTLDNCYLISHQERGYTPPSASLGLVCIAIGAVISAISLLGISLAVVTTIRRARARPSEFQGGVIPAAPVAPPSARGNVEGEEVVLLEASDDADASASAAAGAAATPKPPELIWFHGTKFWGLGSSQKGIVVLRPEYVAFLPTQAAFNLFSELATSAIGLQKIDLSSPQQIDVVVQHLWHSNPHMFDQNLRAAAQHQGGTVFARSHSEVSRNRARSKDGIIFSGSSGRFQGFVTPSPVLERLLAGWQKRPAPLGPTIRTLVVVAALPTLAALVSLVLWGTHPGGAGRDLGTVTRAQALDKSQVPAGSAVSVRAKVDLDGVWSEDEGTGDVLFADPSSPRLIIHCQRNHPFARLLRRMGEADVDSRLAEPRTFSGRIYDGNDVEGAGDYLTLRDYARVELKLASLDDARVLAVGQPPLDNSPPVPLIAVYIWGGFALLLWLALPLAIYRQRRSDLYAATV
jgi:hypothetical protein